MATCPDNSTECLLRAILDANSGVNWNAINFACTAAVGILALGIALAAIFQGFLISGPGRFKASEAAIGTFSAKSRTKFNWRELRMRTTAYTPLINAHIMNQCLAEKMMSDSAQAPNKSKPAAPRVDAQKSGDYFVKYPATWLNLLNFLELDELAFNTLPCQTDYLPSDFQSAPARITVEMLALFAGTAGCDKMEFVNGYPQLTGPSLQVDIRQHAQIGPVASYELFPHNLTFHNTDLPRDHGIYLHSMGILAYKSSSYISLLPGSGSFTNTGNAGPILQDLHSKSGECSHHACKNVLLPTGPFPGELALCLLAANSTDLARTFPNKKLRVWNETKALSDVCKSWRRQSVGNRSMSDISQSLASLLESRQGRLRALDTRTFYAQPLMCDRSEHRITVLHVKHPNLLTPLSALNPGYSWLDPEAPQYPGVRRPQWLLSGPNTPTSVNGGRRLIDDADLVVVHDALRLCIDWLADPTAITLLTEQETKAFKRCALLAQLLELDYWLMKNGGAEAACAVRAIFVALQQTQPSSSAPLGTLSTSASASSSRTVAHDDLDNPITTILVFRAVLYACLLAMALDNSDVLDTNLGRRVIYFA